MEFWQTARPLVRLLPLVWLAAINLVAAVTVAYDKHISRLPRGSIRRVPERRFVRFARLGGGLGTLLFMLLCHHKTKSHDALLLRILLPTLLWICAWLFALSRMNPGDLGI